MYVKSVFKNTYVLSIYLFCQTEEIELQIIHMNTTKIGYKSPSLVCPLVDIAGICPTQILSRCRADVERHLNFTFLCEYVMRASLFDPLIMVDIKFSSNLCNRSPFLSVFFYYVC